MRIVKIQRFSTHDGDGVRTVVFAKGCPLRCRWCHNPETQSFQRQIMFQKNLCIGCGACVEACKTGAQHWDAEKRHGFDSARCVGCMQCADVCVTKAIERAGTDLSVQDIMKKVMRDRAFFGETGGLTVSGGEPMAQPDDCLALLRLARESGITTAVETCGYFDARYTEELCRTADTLLWDYKDSVSARHRQYTGRGNEIIIENLLNADRCAKRIILRCIIVNGVNNDAEHLKGIADIYHRMRHCDRVELIAYHAYAGGKAEQLGVVDNGNTAWIPSDDAMRGLQTRLLQLDVNAVLS